MAAAAPSARPPVSRGSPDHADRHPDAGSVSHHGEGQPRQVAEKRGRHGQVRRHHRRDRDRQGHHGGRGGGRGRPGQDPGPGRHRRRAREREDRASWPPRARTWRPRRAGGGSPAAAAQSNVAAEAPRPARSRPRPRRSAPRAERACDRSGRARLADAGRLRRLRRDPGRDRDGLHDHARSAPRRHGRGDAPRREGLRHGRGGRRVPGRLQGHPGPAAGVRARRVIDTPITEHGFAGVARRRRA